MNGSLPLADQLRPAFVPSARGAVGAVDVLLAAGRESALRFEWLNGMCRVHSAEGVVEAPLPKSVFRAILARLAALCNEHASDSVTPYNGSGELTFGGEVYRVTFTNSPDEQHAEVRFVGAHAESANSVAPANATDAALTSPRSA